MEMVPVALNVATTRLALTSPGVSSRSETRGLGRADGKTVRKVGADGNTPVRLTTTAVAPLGGTPASPATLRVRVPAGPTLLPRHWLSAPERPEGLPALVSQI